MPDSVDQILTRLTPGKFDATRAANFDLERASGLLQSNAPVTRILNFQEAERTADFAFASDQPIEHWFGMVILDTDPKNVDLSRVENGVCPFLVNHCVDQHVGVVVPGSVEIGRVIRGTVKFSRSDEGEEILRDVKDGIRNGTSIGFQIDELILESDKEGEVPVYRAKKWTMLENSSASIPADYMSVGAGRSFEKVSQPLLPVTQAESTSVTERTKMEQVIATPETPVADPGKEVVERNTAEIKAIRNDQEIIEWAEIFGKGQMAREMLLTSKSITLDDVRAKINDERAHEKEIAKRVSPARAIESGSETLGNALISSEEYRRLAPGKEQEVKISIRTNILPSQLFRTTYSGSGDSLTGYDRQPGIVELGQQMPMVADLFMQAQTDSPTVRYMQEATYTQAADMVTEGDEKPEAAFDLAEVDATVRKAAVFSRVTDETLEDFSQIRPYIDQRLSFMVRSKIDDQLLNGSGTAPQIQGLLGTSGIQTAEMSSNTAVKLAEAIMNAITKVRTVGFFEPDAIVIHPNDYQKLRLATDGNTQYYGGGFFQGQYGTGYNDPGSLWGCRVVQTTAISEIDLATPAAGNKGPVVGAFKLGGAVFYRNGLSIESTNTNEDDFINNLVTIRVEQRLALAVYRPLAFCRVINAS